MMNRKTDQPESQHPQAGHHFQGKAIERRDFVRRLGATALAGAAAPLLFNPRMAHAVSMPEDVADTAVGQFYASLSEKQRQAICLPFDHKLRSTVNANWHIREFLIGDDFYSNEQRELINQIARKVMSEDGYERMLKQMEDDDGGMDSYSVAIFGTPGEGKFQWEMTGRHLTLRADGDRDDQVAFGGPLVYGHSESVPSQNLYYYQTQQVNKVFQALDPEQQKLALLPTAPKENAVQVQGSQGSFPGISLDQLSRDQRGLVVQAIMGIMSPYRDEDRQEAKAIVDANGGPRALHLAFYQDRDLENDKIWDVWRIEGPAMVCHFRGAPHVHAYINVRAATV
jgi:hypothetical protein